MPTTADVPKATAEGFMMAIHRAAKLFLVLMCVLNLAACDAATQGVYTNEKDPKETLELRKDGTFLNTELSEGTYKSYSGKYQVDGKRLILILPTGQSAIGTIDGKQITDPEGKTLVKR